MKKTVIILISFLVLTIASCIKEEILERPLSQLNIWNCYNQTTWNNNKITNELIGRWIWIYSENSWHPDEGWETENENTVIEFINDSTLNVSVDDEIVNTAHWTLEIKDTDLYGLVLDKSISQLYGRILICGEIIEFNNSYIDGSDNYFKRIK